MEIHLQGDVYLNVPLEPFPTIQPAYVSVHALENPHIIMVILSISIVFRDALNFYMRIMIQTFVFSPLVVRQTIMQMIQPIIVLLCVLHHSLPLERLHQGDVLRHARKANSLTTQPEDVQLPVIQQPDCIRIHLLRHVCIHAHQFPTSMLIL